MHLSNAAPGSPAAQPAAPAPQDPADDAAAQVRRGQILELEVEGLAFGGSALSHVGGMVVFVENALPGDRVLAKVYRRKRRYAEARAERILRPAPSRVAPRCTHTAICGGCRFQELAYPEQLAHKERQVAECLAHLGGLHATVRAAIAAPDSYHYRNKMEYSFGRNAEGTLTLGLHRRGFFDRPFDLERCHIATPISSEIVAFVRDWARREALSVYDTRRHEGLLRYLMVREGMRTGQVMVNLVATSSHPAFGPWAEDLRRAFPAVASVVLNLTRRKAQTAIGEEERVLAGSATIEEKLGGLTFEISSSSFFQTNTVQAERLLGSALEGLELTGRERVLDIYSGTGTFTLPIAAKAMEAIGIESSDVAVRDAVRNANRNGIENIHFWTGEAVEVLRDRLGLGSRDEGRERGSPDAGRASGSNDAGRGTGVGPTIDSVLVDPPRAGLHPGVVSRLIRLGAPKLVYVSCNPSTLGRDLALLCESRYRVRWIQPVDMFPNTPHIECVATLDREDG